MTGETLLRLPLPQRTTATPMTYRTGGADGRQFIVIATGQGEHAELVALTVPR
jgi:hypothetical protein